MVGTDGLLDLPLQLDLLLLFLLHQQELLLQLALQAPQFLPPLALPLSHLLYTPISKLAHPQMDKYLLRELKESCKYDRYGNILGESSLLERFDIYINIRPLLDLASA